MTHMTHPDDAPPLLNDDEVLDRVAGIVGPASRRRCLWLVLIDGDRRQAPLVVPIEDVPVRPDELVGLRHVLTEVLPLLATDVGAGSVVLVLERPGPDTPTDDDELWLDRLAAMDDVVVDGIYLSTPGGIARLRGMRR